MLPKCRRLTRIDFERLRGAPTLSSEHFSLRSKRLQHGPARYGVVVSKAIGKKAVERNRLRRQVFGYVESFFPSSPAAAAIYMKKKFEKGQRARKNIIRAELFSLAQKLRERLRRQGGDAARRL